MVFVTFNGIIEDVKFYIFTKAEAFRFRNGSMWIRDSSEREGHELNIPDESQEVNEIIMEAKMRGRKLELIDIKLVWTRL
jgi:hypothetical protein